MTHRFARLAAAIALSTSPALATTYFIDDDAPPGGDGLSWATAFDSIDDAFPLHDEVRVAQGTYIPDDNSGDGAGHFVLRGSIYTGGFAGIGAPDPDARDPKAFPTILSGDVNQDDTNDFQNTTDNRVAVFQLVNGVMDGFVVTGTRANPSFGTSFIPYASNVVGGFPVVVRNCHFHHNSASQGGTFALRGQDGDLIEDCTFEHNRAVFSPEDSSSETGDGGAVALIFDRGSTFRNCRFSHNQAVMGGAISSFFDSSDNTSFDNCIFTANVASSEIYGAAGGAVFWADNFASFSFTHCLFYANQAVNGTGGGVFASSFEVQFNNCILWANRDATGRSYAAQTATIIRDRPSIIDGRSLTNIVEGSPSPDPLAEPITLGYEPLFIDPLGPDGILGTDDDDFRPAFGSPAIDAGVTPVFPEPTDFLGRPRAIDDPATPNAAYPAFNGLPDIGPYEYQEDCDDSGTVDSIEIDDGTLTDCDANGVPDVCQPFIDCNGNMIADYCDIASGFSDDCNTNGVPDSCDITLGTSTDENTNDIPDECELTVIFVNAANTIDKAARDGTSWATAHDGLQEALAAARARSAPSEIWVAAGTYHPTHPDGPITTSFELSPGMTLLGGFDGTETDAAQRDPHASPTILSGDNNDNDDARGAESIDDNSLCVLVVPADPDGVFATTVDGFAITRGVGRIIDPAPATVVFVTQDDEGEFVFGPRQWSDHGAAIRTAALPVTFRNCDITGNSTHSADVIDILEGSAPRFEACRFTHNTFGPFGSLLGESNFSSGNNYAITEGYPADPTQLEIVDSTIARNTTTEPFARLLKLRNTQLSVMLTNITANRGIQHVIELDELPLNSFVSAGTVTSIINSAIVANDGTAIAHKQVGPPDPAQQKLLIQSTTIAGNDRALHLSNIHAFVQNSILSSLTNDTIDANPPLTDPASTLSYNTIKAFDLTQNNGTNVSNNIRPDPALFENPFGPDGLVKTGDEDFRLGSGSPSIDSGNSMFAGGATDLDNNPRQVDDTGVPNTGVGPLPPIDRGAYERQTPSTGGLAPADINGDNHTDVIDFAILAAAFGTTPPQPNHDPRADLNQDQLIDVLDFSIFAQAWSNAAH